MRFLFVLEQIAITGVPGIFPIICDPPCNPTLLILCRITLNIRIPGMLNDKILYTLSSKIIFRNTDGSDAQSLSVKTLTMAPVGVLRNMIVPKRVNKVLSRRVCRYGQPCQTKKLNGPERRNRR